MSNHKIVMIEDEPDIIELVKYNLDRNGISVESAQNGEEGISLVQKEKPDLILLDLMLPGMNGLDVCRTLKQDRELKNIPIIILTAKGEESDIVIGLEMGAEDYITKPFSPRELVARVRAALRRLGQEKSNESEDILIIGALAIDSAQHAVTLDGLPLQFTLTEFKLLKALATRPGRVFTRDQLLDKITGGEAIIIDRNVDVHVRAVRKKLGEYGDMIETVRGVGYKFSRK